MWSIVIGEKRTLDLDPSIPVVVGMTVHDRDNIFFMDRRRTKNARKMAIIINNDILVCLSTAAACSGIQTNADYLSKV